MIGVRSDQRARVFRKSVIVAVGLLVLTLLLFNPLSNLSFGASEGDLIFPKFSRHLNDVDRIEVKTADIQYSLERRGKTWVMPERGDYAVRADRIIALTDGVRAMAYIGRKTKDATKHDLIGVGDPARDGSGALITVFTGGNTSVAEFITGTRYDRTYLRFPDRNQSWQVTGNLPPFHRIDQWLAFSSVIDAEPSDVAQVTVQVGGDIPYTFSRVSSDDDFALSDPAGIAASSSYALDPVGRIATKLSPVDVKPTDELPSTTAVIHTVTFFDDETIRLFGYDDDDGHWVTIIQDRLSNEEQATGSQWAFKVSEFDWATLRTRLTDIIPQGTRIEPDIEEAVSPTLQ